MRRTVTRTKYKLHKEYHPRKHNNLIPHGISKEEIAVSNFIALEFPNIPIYRSNRQVLHGKELDIYIPSHKLAVEFDGLKFHSGDSKSKTYHLWKTVECEKQGIQLIHIFSDEWELKKPLVIDLIRKALGKYQNILAQDCILNKISKSEGNNFIENCDILGNIVKEVNYLGLFYNNELVAVMSYEVDGDSIIIHKYTERRLLKVDDGLAKFIDYLDSIMPSKSIIFSIDRRFYTGDNLLSLGFAKYEATEPNTWYTWDFKSKIKDDNIKLEEAIKQGYTPLYDCGNLVFKRQPKIN